MQSQRPADRADVSVLTPSEFEKRLRKLKEGGGALERENPGSYACDDCQSCADCTFCTRSRNLRNCHYSNDCQRCSESSHCDRCVDCHALSHGIECTRCTGGAYLVLCTDCHGCTYCFGCVGLARKDFHILNEPYERTEYFRVTKRLEQELAVQGKRK